MYVQAFFLFFKILNIDFNILPPSKGYKGIRLNIAKYKLEYIIVCFNSSEIANNLIIKTIIIFVKGPAIATKILFSSN